MITKLHVAIPSVDKRYFQECMVSLIMLPEMYPSLTVAPLAGTFLQSQRDQLAADFLMNADASHLLMIDQDVVWAPQHVKMLEELDAPIAFGPYCRKDGSGEPTFIGEVTREQAVSSLEPRRNNGHYTRISFRRCGTGFILIRRDVIEKLWEAYTPTLRYVTPEGDERVGLFQSVIADDEEGIPRLESDDYSFCRRWAAIDGEAPVARTDMWLGHQGWHTYERHTR